MKKNKRGFTIIELVIVCFIIALLVAIVYAAVQSSAKKARDAKRVADLQQIERAVALYYNDNGQYPPVRALTSSEADGCGPSDSWCALKTYLAPYITSWPQDPRGLQNTYRYYYQADYNDNYQTYGLMARLESSTNIDKVINDGGAYNMADLRFYEIGSQPAYCIGRYGACSTTTANINIINACLGNWYSTTANYVCVGDGT